MFHFFVPCENVRLTCRNRAHFVSGINKLVKLETESYNLVVQVCFLFLGAISNAELIMKWTPRHNLVCLLLFMLTSTDTKLYTSFFRQGPGHSFKNDRIIRQL